MKNFNEFAEALMVTTAKPESDSVGPVAASPCPCKSKDLLTRTVEDTLGKIGSPIQPADGIGEYGKVGGDGIGEYADGIGEYGTDGLGEYGMEVSEGGDVEFECLGDEGLIVKFGDTAILLPKKVVEKIKAFEASEESEEEEHEGESDDDKDAHEEESEEEKKEEHEKGEYEESESEESEDEEKDEDKDEEGSSRKVTDVNENVVTEKTDKWIQKAVNKKHKGFCSPMSKPTCTPRRKALAKRFKKGI